MAVDEHLERLIVRSLDGELSDEARLALDRELIRNPEARRLREAYAKVDAVCADAMEQMLGGNLPAVFDDATCSTDRTHSSKKRSSFWLLHRLELWRGRGLLISGAIAAAILATVLPLQDIGPRRGFAPIQRPPSAGLNSTTPGLLPVRADLSHWAGPTYRRDTGREYVGFVDDDGNVYWIEIERTRTLERGLNPLPAKGKWSEM